MRGEPAGEAGYAEAGDAGQERGAGAVVGDQPSVIGAFTSAGVPPDLAEQSRYIFGTSLVSRLAAQEQSFELGDGRPRFDPFLDVLLRGLPAREPPAG